MGSADKVNISEKLEFRDREVWINHRPVVEEEASVMLFEPASTLNTGNVRDEMTVAELDRI